MTSSNVLIFPGRAFDTTKFHCHWSSNREVTHWAESPPRGLPDPEKPGLFRVKNKQSKRM